MTVTEIASQLSRPAEANPASQPVPDRCPGDPPRRWKWTGEDLIRLGEGGFLPRDGRFELLDGEIYELMPPNPPHASDVDLVGFLMEQFFAARDAHTRIEKPIRLNVHYDPQPDIAIVRGNRGRYRLRFPQPEDVLLLIEVSDTSLEYDRRLKLPAYSAAGIPECWLVNLPEHEIEVYRQPSPDGYLSRSTHRSGETLEPLHAPGAEIPVSALFGENAADR